MLQPITKENFNQMISQFTTSELENLVAKFPYTREAHVLLAKKYQLENNPAFDVQLQLAALYTQDRELLFTLFAEKPLEETVNAPAVKEKEPAIEKAIEVIAPPVTPFQEEIIIPEPEVITAPAIQEAPEPIIEKAVEVAPVLPVEEEIQQEIAEEQITPVEIATVPLEIAPEQEQKPAFLATDLHTFDEWIANFAGLPTIERQPITEIKEEPALVNKEQEELDKTIMENVSSDYLHNMVDEETRYARGLDKFIEEQVKKRRKGEYKPPVAQQDDISVEMITETMAGIYEKQKKYAKAIKAYEVLSLKFPEKNDLFATRINYLKTII